MKAKGAICLVFWLFVLLISLSSRSQNSFSLPHNPNHSPVFGTDIIVNDIPEESQSLFTISSALNGWLYGVYTYSDSVGAPQYVLLQSKNNGQSWTELYRHWMWINPYPVVKLDIAAIGILPEDQSLLFSRVTQAGREDVLEVYRYTVEPFTKVGPLLNWLSPAGHHDLAIAHDENFPAKNATPGSFCMLFSNQGVGDHPKDSLIFYYSDDGGVTVKNRTVVRVTSNKITKVSLAYGRSLTRNNGQYFAAWEEKSDTNAILGHIYTSHSTPYFNSTFTTPVMLDGLDPSLTNLCLKPNISCQISNNDNDSTDLSELILFEKYDSATADYDLIGFYNMKGASGNTFRRIDVATGPSNQLDADIRFNSADSTFLVNYYDSTTQKMVLVKKNINFPNPNSWDTVSSGYNNSFPLSKNPKPRVCINQGNNKPVCAWNGKRDNGNGVSLLDAQYLPDGIRDKESNVNFEFTNVSPNPFNNMVSICFNVKKYQKVTITINNLLGQGQQTLFNRELHIGQYQYSFDLSGLQSGLWLYRITAENYFKTGKLIKLK